MSREYRCLIAEATARKPRPPVRERMRIRREKEKEDMAEAAAAVEAATLTSDAAAASSSLPGEEMDTINKNKPFVFPAISFESTHKSARVTDKYCNWLKEVFGQYMTEARDNGASCPYRTSALNISTRRVHIAKLRAALRERLDKVDVFLRRYEDVASGQSEDLLKWRYQSTLLRTTLHQTRLDGDAATQQSSPLSTHQHSVASSSFCTARSNSRPASASTTRSAVSRATATTAASKAPSRPHTARTVASCASQQSHRFPDYMVHPERHVRPHQPPAPADAAYLTRGRGRLCWETTVAREAARPEDEGIAITTRSSKYQEGWERAEFFTREDEPSRWPTPRGFVLVDGHDWERRHVPPTDFLNKGQPYRSSNAEVFCKKLRFATPRIERTGGDQAISPEHPFRNVVPRVNVSSVLNRVKPMASHAWE
eukprot:PhM_4_TR16242/c0_g1_i1/m.84846